MASGCQNLVNVDDLELLLERQAPARLPRRAVQVAVAVSCAVVLCLTMALLLHGNAVTTTARGGAVVTHGTSSFVDLGILDSFESVVTSAVQGTRNVGRTAHAGAIGGAYDVGKTALQAAGDTAGHLSRGEITDAGKAALAGTYETHLALGSAVYDTTYHTGRQAYHDGVHVTQNVKQLAWDSCTTVTKKVALTVFGQVNPWTAGTKAACSAFILPEEGAVATAAASNAGVNPVLDAMTLLLPPVGVFACKTVVETVFLKAHPAGMGVEAASGEFAEAFCKKLKHAAK